MTEAVIFQLVNAAVMLGIPHWQVVPCLLFTLMLGPVGLVLYLTLRRITRGHWVLSAQP